MAEGTGTQDVTKLRRSITSTSVLAAEMPVNPLQPLFWKGKYPLAVLMGSALVSRSPVIRRSPIKGMSFRSLEALPHTVGHCRRQ